MIKYWHIALCLFLASCSSEEQPPEPEFNWSKENSSTLSKSIASDEEIDIKLYLEMRPDWKMEQTGSGLRYYIYKHGEGETPQPEEIAEIEYSIELLDGTECYRTEDDEYEELVMERSEVESGVHEALKLMRPGDKAKLIIPSHLGHGLLGDMDKIPPLTVLVVDITLLGIKK